MSESVVLLIVLGLGAVSLAVYWVVKKKVGTTDDQWTDIIRFAPTEPLSPERLFGLLLSANITVMNQDNFNQLASTRSKEDVAGSLSQWWGIDNRDDYVAALERLRGQLDAPDPDYIEAMQALRDGRTLDTDEFQGLVATQQVLVKDNYVPASAFNNPAVLDPAAWTLQRFAMLVRAGFTLGYLERDAAWALLQELATRARRHYRSWADFSLSYLLARGMWSPIDPDAPGEDFHMARQSHLALTTLAESPVHKAAAW